MSPGRISQLIGEALCERTEAITEMADHLRTLELERIDRIILAWYMRAKQEPRASEILLHWLERRHKLLGLDTNKTEFSGPGGGPIRVSASQIDLSKLNDQELQRLETIVAKAGPQLPAGQTLVATLGGG